MAFQLRRLRPGIACRRLGRRVHCRQPRWRRVLYLPRAARPGRRQSRRENRRDGPRGSGHVTRWIPRANIGCSAATNRTQPEVRRHVPAGGMHKGLREMSVPELRARIASCAKAANQSTRKLRAPERYSIPACLVFGLIGLALGATNRRDGKLASFVSESPSSSPITCCCGSGNPVRRSADPPLARRLVGQTWSWELGGCCSSSGGIASPISHPGPYPEAFATASRSAPGTGAHRAPLRNPRSLRRHDLPALAGTVGALHWPACFTCRPSSTCPRRSSEGPARGAMLGTFFVYTTPTPQFLLHRPAVAVLLASLVTVAILTKNSELVVMKACGISLYRFACRWWRGVAAGAFLFALEQTVLGPPIAAHDDPARAQRRLARNIRRAESPMGRGRDGGDLPLRVLRSACDASRHSGSTSSTKACGA